MALKQSDSSSPESGFRRTKPSPNMRQKRGERSRELDTDIHAPKVTFDMDLAHTELSANIGDNN